MRRAICGVLVCFLLVSCGGRGPQRPSQRSGSSPKEDSTALVLIALNQRLAADADERVLKYVTAREDAEHFAQMPFSNAWARITDNGESEGVHPQKDEIWCLHIKIYSLSGELLLDSEGEYRIGRSELPLCIELAIGEWGHGTEVIMVAPWYSAYGMSGTEDVGAYENVLLEITIQ